MYIRVYPTKNNTIFRYLDFSKDLNTIIKSNYESVNAGANSIMELMDGRGESKLMFKFDFSSDLISLLQNYDYTAKLQLWDAGTLYEPAIKLKNLKLESFFEDFSEGDGYSFLAPDIKNDVSNWTNRDSINLWSGVSFSNVETQHLSRINEDLNFNVSTNISDAIEGNKTSIGFSLKIDNRENDHSNIYRKFIHSNYTKTVFKPYIEFFIEDNIIDKTYNFLSETTNRIYLINQNNVAFSGAVVAKVTFPGVNEFEVTASTNTLGVYFVDIDAPVKTNINKEFVKVIWKINGVDYQKNTCELKNINQINEEYDIDNLFFYPTASSTHNTFLQGDIIPFSIISEIRGKGKVIIDTYEYRITSADGFEMLPWQAASVYKDKIYFTVNTSYFYPENQYQVFVRNRTNQFSINTHLTFKFDLKQNDKSHLRQLTTSPYYSREQFFSK